MKENCNFVRVPVPALAHRALMLFIALDLLLAGLTLNTRPAYALRADDITNDTTGAGFTAGEAIPDINATPASHDFGPVGINTSSPAQTFTIENQGTTDLTINGVSMVGAGVAHFSNAGGTCSTPQILAPTNACTVDITFDPASTGVHNVTLRITSNDSDEGTVDIPLSGEGTAPIGDIVIIKDTVPDGPRDFAFTTIGGLSPATFELDDDASATLSNTQSFSDVMAGTYTITETAVAGYTTAISCEDPDNGSTTSGSTATIDLDTGETVTCTFTNTRGQGTVTFIKSVVGGSAAPTDWTFDITDGPQDIAHNGQMTLDAGRYAITEDGPNGYAVSGASGACAIENNQIILTVENGGGTCTITNAIVGSLTLIKEASPKDGTDFSFTASGPGILKGIPVFNLLWGTGVNGGDDPEVCSVAADCEKGIWPPATFEGGKMGAPIDMAVDSQGNVFVADSDLRRIQKFDANGNFILTWGSGVNGGSGPEICTVAASCTFGQFGDHGGGFGTLGGIAVDSSDNVYVTGFSKNRVQKFDNNGNFIRMWGGGVNGGTGPEICTVATNCREGTNTGTQGGEFGSCVEMGEKGVNYKGIAGKRR